MVVGPVESYKLQITELKGTGLQNWLNYQIPAKSSKWQLHLGGTFIFPFFKKIKKSQKQSYKSQILKGLGSKISQIPFPPKCPKIPGWWNLRCSSLLRKRKNVIFAQFLAIFRKCQKQSYTHCCATISRFWGSKMMHSADTAPETAQRWHFLDYIWTIIWWWEDYTSEKQSLV